MSGLNLENTNSTHRLIMNLYTHIGPGSSNPAVIVVLAGSRKTAAKLIRRQLNALRLERALVNIQSVVKVESKPKVIYVDEGGF